MPRGHGGRRPGAGRKPGKSLTKEAAREVLRQMVIADMGPLISAQLANAKGLKYLVCRNAKTGKFERVTPETASSDTIEVWEKDPSIQAFTDLMNRALDKPADQIHTIELTGELTLVDRLHAARQRLAHRVG